MKSRTLPLILAAAVLVITAGTAVADVRGSPKIKVSLQEDTVAAGDETTLEVVLVNSGDLDSGSAENPSLNSEVTTARGLTVDIADSKAPISVTTGARSLGNLQAGAPETASFDISVDENAEPGTYRVPVDLEYDYYSRIENDGDRQRSSTAPTKYVELTVSDDATFDVTNVSSTAQVGSSGTVAVTVENTGQTTAYDADVTLETKNEELTFGERTRSTRTAGEWAPGETRTFEYDVTASDDAQAEPYPFSLSVAFDNPDGVQKESSGTSISVTPDTEQSFSISTVDSSLRVGEERTITTSITNDGPRVVSDVVVNWESDKSNLSPQETQIAVGTLEPGESTNATFTVDVTESAEQGPKQFDFVASYRNSEGDRVDSDTLDTQATVAASQDEFALEPVNATVSAGGSSTIDIKVTNERDVRLSEISAKLFASSPIETDDDEAFISELGPGESETITFSLSAEGSALEKSYPFSVDFEYTEPDGDTVLSDTYRKSVEVTTENGGGGLPLTAVGGVALVLVLAVGGYVRFR